MLKNRTTLIQRLTILFYFQIAGWVCSLFDYIPVGTTLLQWIQRLSTVGSIVCLFCLAFAGRRYLTAAIWGTVQFVFALFCDSIPFLIVVMHRLGVFNLEDLEVYNNVSAALNLVASVAGIVYTYQVYHAHGDLVKELDATLCRKWGGLFGWSFAVSFLTTVAYMIFANVYIALGWSSQSHLSVFNILANLPGKVVILFSVIYLKRTIQTLRNCEE